MTEITTTRDINRIALAEARRDIVAASQAVAGLYRMQLRKRAVWSPVRIWLWLGQPLDPANPPKRDEAVMRAELRGAEVHINKVWPWCAGEPIERAEYEYLLALHKYAIQHEPDLPEASPYQAVDFNKLKFEF